MTATKKHTLAFGLGHAVPETADASWGARLIFPDDLLYDRQDFYGIDTDEGQRLKSWLNGGALRAALDAARKLADNNRINPTTDEQVTIYEDDTGIVVGNPNASYGYLYVASWLKREEDA